MIPEVLLSTSGPNPKQTDIWSLTQACIVLQCVSTTSPTFLAVTLESIIRNVFGSY